MLGISAAGEAEYDSLDEGAEVLAGSTNCGWRIDCQMVSRIFESASVYADRNC